MMTWSIQQFNDLGIKTLVTSCAGCLKTIKDNCITTLVLKLILEKIWTEETDCF